MARNLHYSGSVKLLPKINTTLVLVLLVALGAPEALAERSHRTRSLRKAPARQVKEGSRRKVSRVRRWSRRQVRKLKRLLPRKRVAVGKGKVRGKGKAPGKIRTRVKGALGAMSRKLHLPQLKRSLARKLCVARGYCTLAADRVEKALPKRLAKGYSKLRLASPGHLAAFTGSKFKQDPLFLGSFGVAYPIATHLQIPAFIAMGMNPAAALVAHEVIEIPLGLGILAWRQHALRKDKSVGFGGTLKSLGKEHAEFARSRQQESRRFMKQRAMNKQRAKARQQGSLQQMGLALATQ